MTATRPPTRLVHQHLPLALPCRRCCRCCYCPPTLARLQPKWDDFVQTFENVSSRGVEMHHVPVTNDAIAACVAQGCNITWVGDQRCDLVSSSWHAH